MKPSNFKSRSTPLKLAPIILAVMNDDDDFVGGQEKKKKNGTQ
jgi:hypothetical protein